MLILIEGADGTGKTTLANKLCDEYGFQYLHFGIPDEHPMDYWFKTLVTINQPTVIDRLHLSEEVYGPIYRDGSQLSPHDFWLIEGWLWARDCVVLMCKVPTDVMYDNQMRVKGEYHDNRQSRVVDGFGKSILQTSLPVAVFNYTDPSAFVTVNADIPAPVEWGDHGMGGLSPDIWLVGDRHGTDPNDKIFGPQTCFGGGSGEYLRKTIGVLGWRWRAYHLSNSHTWDGEPIDLATKWALLGYPRPVALGRIADKALSGFKIPHTQVPHPQYWRRFKHHDMEGYADEIARAS